VRRRNQRLWMIGGAAVVLVGAISLALVALNDSIVLFYSPSEVAAAPPEPGTHIRVGGLVEAGSVIIPAEGGAIFVLTDGAETIEVHYHGSLPDLFREGQGIVAEGTFLETSIFEASTVLAKHDETYMPPEVADALRDAGHWQGEEGS
jgi:cytochrome c-type biogenesis protein CcmE